MRSPFPGMDPFIEDYNLWEDFHRRLVAAFEVAVTDKLPQRYVARFGERYYVDAVDPDTERSGRRTFVSDFALDAAARAEAARERAETAVAECPPGALVMRGMVEAEHRELFLEIRDMDRGRRLVTTIEVLSPSNKRPGEEGWLQYEDKRRVFFHGHANLVEIDFLRGGRRHRMAQPWPTSPYYVMLVRPETAPESFVWPAHSLQSLPEIPVPLLAPDQDVMVNLQTVLETIYTRGRYGSDIDYRRPRRLRLTAEESAWLSQHLPPSANGSPAS